MRKTEWCLVNIGEVQRQIVAINKRNDLSQQEKQTILTRLNSELKGYEAAYFVALPKESNAQAADG